MSNHPNAPDDKLEPLTIVLFGQYCHPTLLIFDALLASGFKIAGVVLSTRPAAARTMIRLYTEDEQVMLNRIDRAGASLFEAYGNSIDVRDAILDLAPGVIVSACFPKKIPSEILAVARFGGLNVHPSLLPRWRGPDPIAWTLRSGDTITGTTVHVMDDRFDAGPIVRQSTVAVRPGIVREHLEEQLFHLGAALLVDALADLSAGALVSMPQDEVGVTFAPER